MSRVRVRIFLSALLLASPAAVPETRSDPARPSILPAALTHPANFPEQSARSNEKWGSVLADIARHLPSDRRYQDAYSRYMQAGDLVTAGHEWTHFLNEYLTLKSGGGTSAYYLLGNNYVTLADPDGLRGHVPRIPCSLRGDLYDLYLVQNAGNARIDPLYLFDEWAAYTNDVAVAVDQLESGKPLNRFDRRIIQPRTAANVLEFMFYGYAVGMSVKEHDPRYYRSEEGNKLRGFIRLNARRSMDIYRKGLQHDELSRGEFAQPLAHAPFPTFLRHRGDVRWVRNELGGDLVNTLAEVEASSVSAWSARGSLHLTRNDAR